MKKLLYLVVAIFILTGLFLSTGCEQKPEETPVVFYLTITVVQNPAGGQNVSALTCTYNVKYTYDGYQEGSQWYNSAGEKRLAPQPAKLTVEWENDKGSTYNTQDIKFSLDSKDAKSGSFTTTFSAKAGMVLDKTFWVDFT